MRKKLSSFFRGSALSDIQTEILLQKMQAVCPDITALKTEWRFYVDTSAPLTEEETRRLSWLLAETFQPEQFGTESMLDNGKILEVGPRLGIVTPHSTNAVSICHACGLTKVTRVEKARRYRLEMTPGTQLTPEQSHKISQLLYDRMTEELYEKALKTFDPRITPDPVRTIPLIEKGLDAFKEFAKETGLS